MKSRVTGGFRRLHESLPDTAKSAARRAYRRFQENPHHPGLQFKQVHSRRNLVSARINDDYRVISILEGDTVNWFWIGPHTEYERLLRRS